MQELKGRNELNLYLHGWKVSSWEYKHVDAWDFGLCSLLFDWKKKKKLLTYALNINIPFIQLNSDCDAKRKISCFWLYIIPNFVPVRTIEYRTKNKNFTVSEQIGVGLNSCGHEAFMHQGLAGGGRGDVVHRDNGRILF